MAKINFETPFRRRRHTEIVDKNGVTVIPNCDYGLRENTNHLWGYALMTDHICELLNREQEVKSDSRAYDYVWKHFGGYIDKIMKEPWDEVMNMFIEVYNQGVMDTLMRPLECRLNEEEKKKIEELKKAYHLSNCDYGHDPDFVHLMDAIFGKEFFEN